MKGVVIGAGRIGCGLAADLLHRSGHEIVMVGRGPAIDALARTRACTVRLTDGRSATDHIVAVADAVHIADTGRVARHVADADVVCTAVGADRLDTVADLIAPGLARAPRPVDVLAFENRLDAAAVLRTAVTDRLGDRGSRHGFSGTVIARAVAQRVLPVDDDANLLVVGDRSDEVHVDAAALTGAWASVPGLVGVESFPAYYRRKLYRFSAGHATAAYVGAVKGYRYLHAAVADPEIAAAVLGAMEEGRQGLDVRYGPAVAGTRAELTGILARFGNAVLGDTVERVGRDVPRKLARGERLVGAARLAHAAGVRPTHLALAAAAALDRCPSLTGATDEVTPRQLASTVSRITGVRPDHRLALLIADLWAQLAAGGCGESPLLSLTRRTWAWAPRPAHLGIESRSA
ncbi:MAG: hypothetical protein L0G22_08410 [Propionibacteriaceae bacterium]|nr:hypothetical protein [Propionibacteriaceae bacterium]